MIKFTVEISNTEIAFLDTVVYKGARFDTESMLDIKTQYKANRDLPIHPLYLLAPPRCKTRFHKGCSYQTLTYKLLGNTLPGGHLKF